jgi:16S rRNA pseudouridine516 synthase
MRLDKYLCHARQLSRTQVRSVLKTGAVTVNGNIVKKPSHAVTVSDSVMLDGEIVDIPAPRYFMLNKPSGYVCATIDAEHPTVVDLINEPNKGQLQIAGRLDIDATGLVLLTDDGQWNHCITSPRHGHSKVYQVQLAAPLDTDIEVQFQQGIWLKGEKRPTLPAHCHRLAEREVELCIQEGRYHQVKRMFAAVNNRVLALHRCAIAHITLDSSLQPGQYRPLTTTEIAGKNPPHRKEI